VRQQVMRRAERRQPAVLNHRTTQDRVEVTASAGPVARPIFWLLPLSVSVSAASDGLILRDVDRVFL
jgi:hypothetical protein